jgi:Fe-S-cluster containining protein
LAKEAKLSEMLIDYSKGVVDLHNPSCVDCNECCSMGAMITPEEYKHLSHFLRKDKRGKEIYNSGLKLIIDHAKHNTLYYMCPFSINKRCSIYNKRPEICRAFHCSAELNDNNYIKDETKEHCTIYDLWKKDVRKVWQKKG